jgi:hypothetical protein
MGRVRQPRFSQESNSAQGDLEDLLDLIDVVSRHMGDPFPDRDPAALGNGRGPDKQ